MRDFDASSGDGSVVIVTGSCLPLRSMPQLDLVTRRHLRDVGLGRRRPCRSPPRRPSRMMSPVCSSPSAGASFCDCGDHDRGARRDAGLLQARRDRQRPATSIMSAWFCCSTCSVGLGRRVGDVARDHDLVVVPPGLHHLGELGRVVRRGDRHGREVEVPRGRVGLVALTWMTLVPLKVPEGVLGQPGRHHDVRHRRVERDEHEHEQHGPRCHQRDGASGHAEDRLIGGSSLRTPGRRAAPRMATPWLGSVGTDATGRPLLGVGLRQRLLHPQQRGLGVVAALVVAIATEPAGPDHGQTGRRQRRHQPPQHLPSLASAALCRLVRAVAPPASRFGRRIQSTSLAGTVPGAVTACRPTPRCRR